MGGAVILPQDEKDRKVVTGFPEIDALGLDFNPWEPNSFVEHGAKRLDTLREKDSKLYAFWKRMGLVEFVKMVDEATVKRDCKTKEVSAVSAMSESTEAPAHNEVPTANSSQDIVPLTAKDKSHLEVMTEHLSNLPMASMKCTFPSCNSGRICHCSH